MEYLRYWRLVAGLTQKKAARQVGISQGHFCMIEKRGTKPSPDLYPKLAKAIRRPVEELVAKLNGVNASEMCSSVADAR